MNGKEKVDICKSCGRTIGASEGATVVEGGLLCFQCEQQQQETSVPSSHNEPLASLKAKFISIFTSKENRHPKPSYPPIAYFLGSVNFAAGLLFIIVGGYVIGIPLTIFAVVFLLIHRKSVYIAFCVIYGIGIVFNIFSLLRNPKMIIFLSLTVQSVLLWYLISYYPYLFGTKVKKSIAEKLYKKALKAEHNGNIEEAIEIYRKVISDFSDTVAAEDARNYLEIIQKEENK